MARSTSELHRIAILCCWICILVGSFGATTSRKYKCRKGIPDVSLLLLPGTPAPFIQNRKYNGSPNYRYTIDGSYNCSKQDNPTKDHYCPTVTVVTVDLNRDPMWIVEKKCANCTRCQSKNVTIQSSGICKNMEVVREVCVRKRGKMYQTVFVGCYCDLTKQEG